MKPSALNFFVQTASKKLQDLGGFVNSKDAEGNIIAEAYCEAKIQRTVDYVDPTNPNETPANNPFGNPSDLTEINRKFGRRLKITAFKWLTKQEI